VRGGFTDVARIGSRWPVMAMATYLNRRGHICQGLVARAGAGVAGLSSGAMVWVRGELRRLVVVPMTYDLSDTTQRTLRITARVTTPRGVQTRTQLGRYDPVAMTGFRFEGFRDVRSFTRVAVRVKDLRGRELGRVVLTRTPLRTSGRTAAGSTGEHLSVADVRALVRAAHTAHDRAVQP